MSAHDVVASQSIWLGRLREIPDEPYPEPWAGIVGTYVVWGRMQTDIDLVVCQPTHSPRFAGLFISEDRIDWSIPSEKLRDSLLAAKAKESTA